jgi:uncharacterized peroxidase-related enzyme
MTRVRALTREEVDPLLHEAMATQERQLGLVPQSLLTMAHRPKMAAAWANLTRAVIGPGSVDGALKQLVAYMASHTHGCRYCQAHTAHNAERLGMSQEKLLSAFDAERSDAFSEAERSALALARDAAMVPNQVTDEHFERLRRSYSDEQIVEIMGVIAMFGWLNRWNDSMATTLEAPPLQWAERTLASQGWDVGPHVDSPAAQTDSQDLAERR